MSKKQKEKTEQSSSPKRLLIPLSLSAEEAYEALVTHLKVKPEEKLQVVFRKQPRNLSKTQVKKRLDMHKLSQSTIEKLGYYVYSLSDPRTGKTFYVGKGCGNRINHHLLGALEGKTKETDKIKMIRDIVSSGLEVDLRILRHGLTEKEALEVESSIIDFIGTKNLTNLVQGHHSYDRGIMSLSDLKIEYEAENAVFDEPVMLININKLYRYNMSSEEIFEVTKGNWKVGPRAQGFEIVCAEYRGIIREVFKSQGWHRSEGEGRSYFEGVVAPDSIRNKYIHKSVAKYKKQGSQNPIKYID